MAPRPSSGAAGMADLPHHEHVERGAERACHADRDRDTAARNGEDDRAAGGADQRVMAEGPAEARAPFGIIGLASPRTSRSAAPSSTPASVRSLKAGGPDGAASRRAGGLPISPARIPGGQGQ